MPLDKTSSPRFGMVADKFGVGWMIIVPAMKRRRVRWSKQMTADAQTKSKDFVISRVFDAPRELVWKCFTDPERMKQWWGPKGFKVRRLQNGSARRRHLSLRHADARRHSDVGQVRLSRDRRRRRSWSSSIRSPTKPAASRVIRWRQPGRWRCCRPSPSRISPAARPSSPSAGRRYNATAEEHKTFDAGHASMTQGWSGTLDQLEAYLAKAAQTTEECMLRRWNYHPCAEEETRGLSRHVEEIRQGLPRARRAGIPRERRRRRESREADVVPAQRQAQGRRDRGICLGRLQIARARATAPRQRS